ncbi:MAG: amidohydrolase family protein [Gemmataceae bacterium]|nr:amidohydrolase family protein [Gemmataceae bacterium]
MSRTFTARWVFPVSGPPLENGTVTVAGDRIDAVLPKGERTPDEDFGNAALIPGLVNAHTHLDLSGARGQIPPTNPEHFTDWLRGVIAFRRSRSPEQTQDDIRAGLAECLRFGTTLVGDIASEGASWDALAAAPTRAVVFREMIGLTRESWMRSSGALSVWAKTPDTPTCRKAASPHAPYSASGALIRSVAWNGWTMTVHLAESPGELELLEHRTGPFRNFLESLGVWEPDNIADSLRYVLWRTRRSPAVILAHANYLPVGSRLSPNQTIAYCPRTHAAFDHPPHPFREFLARGVRVCLGTDSLGSNPDLDILAEARFVRSRYPDFPGDQLLRMVTLLGAEALGWEVETGSLESGKSADFVVVPLPNADAVDPHELLFTNHPGDRRTMFRGAFRE